MNSEGLYQINLNYAKTHSSSFFYNVILDSPENTEKLSVTDTDNGNLLFCAHSAGELLLSISVISANLKNTPLIGFMVDTVFNAYKNKHNLKIGIIKS